MKKQLIIALMASAMLTISISISAQQPGSMGTPSPGMTTPTTTPGVINPNSPINPNTNQVPNNSPGAPGYYSNPNPAALPGVTGVSGATGTTTPGVPANTGISGPTGPNNISTPGGGASGPFRP